MGNGEAGGKILILPVRDEKDEKRRYEEFGMRAWSLVRRLAFTDFSQPLKHVFRTGGKMHSLHVRRILIFVL